MKRAAPPGLAQAAAKARGVHLGNPRLKRITEPRKREVRAFAENLRPVFVKMRAAGLSQRKMVTRLNEQEIPPAAGTPWNLVKVQKVPGVSKAVVSRTENSKFPLKPKSAVLLAHVLGGSAHELLGL